LVDSMRYGLRNNDGGSEYTRWSGRATAVSSCSSSLEAERSTMSNYAVVAAFLKGLPESSGHLTSTGKTLLSYGRPIAERVSPSEGRGEEVQILTEPSPVGTRTVSRHRTLVAEIARDRGIRVAVIVSQGE